MRLAISAHIKSLIANYHSVLGLSPLNVPPKGPPWGEYILSIPLATKTAAVNVVPLSLNIIG